MTVYFVLWIISTALCFPPDYLPEDLFNLISKEMDSSSLLSLARTNNYTKSVTHDFTKRVENTIQVCGIESLKIFNPSLSRFIALDSCSRSNEFFDEVPVPKVSEIDFSALNYHCLALLTAIPLQNELIDGVWVDLPSDHSTFDYFHRVLFDWTVNHFLTIKNLNSLAIRIDSFSPFLIDVLCAIIQMGSTRKIKKLVLHNVTSTALVSLTFRLSPKSLEYQHVEVFMHKTYNYDYAFPFSLGLAQQGYFFTDFFALFKNLKVIKCDLLGIQYRNPGSRVPYHQLQIFAAYSIFSPILKNIKGLEISMEHLSRLRLNGNDTRKIQELVIREVSPDCSTHSEVLRQLVYIFPRLESLEISGYVVPDVECFEEYLTRLLTRHSRLKRLTLDFCFHSKFPSFKFLENAVHLESLELKSSFNSGKSWLEMDGWYGFRNLEKLCEYLSSLPSLKVFSMRIPIAKTALFISKFETLLRLTKPLISAIAASSSITNLNLDICSTLAKKINKSDYLSKLHEFMQILKPLRNLNRTIHFNGIRLNLLTYSALNYQSHIVDDFGASTFCIRY